MLTFLMRWAQQPALLINMIKEIGDEELVFVKEWGEGKNPFTILPKYLLPDGLIAYVDDKPVVAGFMYVTTDKAMGFIAFIICNPDSDAIARGKAFPELLEGFNAKAKELGVQFLFTTTNNASLTNRLRNDGFIECDTDVVHLLKPVK